MSEHRASNIAVVVPKVVPKTSTKASTGAQLSRAVQVAPSSRKAIYIDLTQDSDSEGDLSGSSGGLSRTKPLRARPTITAAAAAVSKQPTTSAPAPPSRSLPCNPVVTRAGLAVTMAGAAGYALSDADSESDDEMLLVSMLTAGDSDSDMDCGSSDVEFIMGTLQVRDRF